MADSDIYRTILPAGTVLSANGQSGPIRLADNTDPGTLDVVVNITALSGTSPTLTVTVQRDNDADTGAYPPASWTAGTSSAALSTVSRTVVSAPSAARDKRNTEPAYYRVTWVIGGTASPTFTVGVYGK